MLALCTLLGGAALLELRRAPQRLGWPLLALATLLLVAPLQLLPSEALVSALSPTPSSLRSLADLEPPAAPTLSAAPARSVERWRYLAAMTLLVLAATVAPVAPRTVLSWLAFAAVAQAFAGLATYRPHIAGEAQRLIGTFRNPNHFAGLMGLGAIASLGVAWSCELAPSAGGRLGQRIVRAIDDPQQWLRLGAFGAAIVCSIALALSLSRGGIAVGALGVAMFSLLISEGRRRWHAVMFAAGLLLALTVWIASEPRALARLAEVDAGSSRLLFYRDALALIGDYPLVGAGLGSFEAAYLAYQSQSLGEFQVDFVHNDYLQLACEAGLPVAALAVGALGWLLWRVGRRITAEHGSERVVGAALLAMLLVGMGRALVGFDTLIPGVGAWLAVLLGVAQRWHAGDDPVTGGSFRAGCLIAMVVAISGAVVIALAPASGRPELEAAWRSRQALQRELLDQVERKARGWGKFAPAMRPLLLVDAQRRRRQEVDASKDRVQAALRSVLAGDPLDARVHAVLALELAKDRRAPLAAVARRALAAQRLYPAGGRYQVLAAFAVLLREPGDAQQRAALTAALASQPPHMRTRLTSEGCLLGLAGPLAEALPATDRYPLQLCAHSAMRSRQYDVAAAVYDRLLVRKASPRKGWLRIRARCTGSVRRDLFVVKLRGVVIGHIPLGPEWTGHDVRFPAPEGSQPARADGAIDGLELISASSVYTRELVPGEAQIERSSLTID